MSNTVGVLALALGLGGLVLCRWCGGVLGALLENLLVCAKIAVKNWTRRQGEIPHPRPRQKAMLYFTNSCSN
jgi:hypothetical protein